MLLRPGLYEQVINERIKQELEKIPAERRQAAPIDGAEAPRVLARYVAGVVQKKLNELSEGRNGVAGQVRLVNRMIDMLGQDDGAVRSGLSVDRRAEQLLALLGAQDPDLAMGKTARDLERPETSLAESSLFTGAVREPQMFSELKREIRSCSRIDMLVSFIKWSGLRLIFNELKNFTQRGGHLRVITTSYMGATDVKAVDELSHLPNTEIKVSYDTDRTRLHAKAYVFYRDTGFTTAYVGSSNLSHAALAEGLEWNVKVTAKDLPETLAKMNATFDSYWHSEEFSSYRTEERGRLAEAIRAERDSGREGRPLVFDIRPYSFQQAILDRLEAERTVHGRYRNLITAATGTGKTVIAAFDYRRFCQKHPGQRNRLLFVAHREEILKQAQDTFQGVLKDPNFGDLFVGHLHPEQIDHLFISVQMINARALWDIIPSDYYDYMVVDEFHHAAARTYQEMLSYFHPQILLGLTATPERMDGKNILDYFDGRTAADIRLPEAIDRQLLCPFQYFGVTDTVDLRRVRWVRGGYDRTELSRLYSMDRAAAERRADGIIRALEQYVTDMHEVKGLGFCVSVEHARFMAAYFNRCGIPAVSLSSESPGNERWEAREQLRRGEIRMIFTVDLYNEGVDIPEVNTVLFLRPTESLTVFLQQLGRGLRRCPGKDCLTVLDFIGQANQKYRFEDKFSALLSRAPRSMSEEIRKGFTALPAGCYIQLEKKASEYILTNIRSSLNSRAGLVGRMESFEDDSGQKLTFTHFIDYYHMEAKALLCRGSFSRLSVQAGMRPDFREAEEETVTKALPRLADIDSRRWILFLQCILPRLGTADLNALTEGEKRMMEMFYVTLWKETAESWDEPGVRDKLVSLAGSPVMMAEILEVLKDRYDRIDLVDAPVDAGFDCPLDLHCTYTRDQLLAALDYRNPSHIREGVKWLPEHQTDVLMVTLNKAEKDYSPTTLYRDYSVNERLFHWQSQSTTSADSPTGQRYIHHRERGSRIWLFVRENKTDRFGYAEAYAFLGPAYYLQHEGSRPMNITWRLENPIPAKYLRRTNQLVVV